jgi:hypothetical protein
MMRPLARLRFRRDRSRGWLFGLDQSLNRLRTISRHILGPRVRPGETNFSLRELSIPIGLQELKLDVTNTIKVTVQQNTGWKFLAMHSNDDDLRHSLVVMVD